MKIQKMIARPPIILKEIAVANSAYVSALSQDPITVGTNLLIQDLKQTSTRYYNLHAQVSISSQSPKFLGLSTT